MISALKKNVAPENLLTDLRQKYLLDCEWNTESVEGVELPTNISELNGLWERCQLLESSVAAGSEPDLDEQIATLERIYEVQAAFLAEGSESVATLKADAEEKRKAIEECKVVNADMEREIVGLRQQLLDIEREQHLNKSRQPSRKQRTKHSEYSCN